MSRKAATIPQAALCCLFFSALPGCAAMPPAGRLFVTNACVLSRDSGPNGLSGLAYVGGGRYLAANDLDGCLYELEMPLAPDGKTVAGCETGACVRLQGAVDLEGVAYDPLTGNVWAADEWSQTIRCFSPSGEPLGDAPVPDIFRKTRYLMGFESLSMRGDGLEMWTANEEALPADGPGSSRTNGTLVRLVRYLRDGAGDAWRVAAQYPYRADPIAGGDFRAAQRSGVADLCVLDDGSLLALEREMSRVAFVPRFRARLYLVSADGADDVKDVPALAGRDVRVAKKTLLYETLGLAMFEGLALGPALPDGSRLLVLVSDGDNGGLNRVLTLRLVQAPGPEPR